VHTTRIKEGVMAKHGERSHIKTFIQKSAVICDQTAILSLDNELGDDDMKKPVKVSIIPL